MIFKNFPFDALLSTTVATAAVAVTAVAARGTKEADIHEDAHDSSLLSTVHAAAFVPDKIHGAVRGAFEDVSEDGIEESLALENATTPKKARELVNGAGKEHITPSDDMDLGILGRAEDHQRNLEPEAPSSLNCPGESNEIYIYIDGGADFASLYYYVGLPMTDDYYMTYSYDKFYRQVEKIRLTACLASSACDEVPYSMGFESNYYYYPQCQEAGEGIWIKVYSYEHPDGLASAAFEMWGSFVDGNKEGEPFPRQTITFSDPPYEAWGWYFAPAWTYHTIPPTTRSPSSSPSSSSAPSGSPSGSPSSSPSSSSAPSGSPSGSPSSSPTSSSAPSGSPSGSPSSSPSGSPSGSPSSSPSSSSAPSGYPSGYPSGSPIKRFEGGSSSSSPSSSPGSSPGSSPTTKSSKSGKMGKSTKNKMKKGKKGKSSSKKMKKGKSASKMNKKGKTMKSGKS